MRYGRLGQLPQRRPVPLAERDDLSALLEPSHHGPGPMSDGEAELAVLDVSPGRDYDVPGQGAGAEGFRRGPESVLASLEQLRPGKGLGDVEIALLLSVKGRRLGHRKFSPKGA